MDGELETALNPKAYNTVDPEVRAYVYSLVSAVESLYLQTSPDI